MLAGAYDGPTEHQPVEDAEPLVVFAGRHIPEKGVPVVVAAVAELRKKLPSARATIFGDGPERGEVQRRVAELGLQDVVDVPGFVATEVVDRTIARALCMVLPSRREGYGLIVVEAAARGTPSVVVAGEDNAAVELVAEGENGFISPSRSPRDLADAIWAVHVAGPALRQSTSRWFDANVERMSLGRSLEIALGVYADAPA